MRLFRRRPALAPSRTVDETLSLPPERALFIIGAARSGTTVLQNALNHSPEIFLLGEPELYDDHGPGFAARYNAMHRSWGNQEAKSSHLPAVSEVDGDWRDHLAALARHHRWVGAKLVLNAVHAHDEIDRRFDFHTRNFYRSRYIFAFRDPVETAISTRDLQLLGRGETDGLAAILRNVVEMIGFYVRAVRLLPHVRAVFHGHVDAETFQELAQWLGTPLPAAIAYYDSSRVRDYSQASIGPEPPPCLDAVCELYRDLRSAAAKGFATPQLEQNDHHLNPTHYTTLGSLDRRARMLTHALTALEQ